MTLPSTLISYIIGLPLGVLLVITRAAASAHAHVQRRGRRHRQLLRSIPFIILLAMLFPVTRVVMAAPSAPFR